jgi:uncharacterized protein YjbI with pentapeptide repeats
MLEEEIVPDFLCPACTHPVGEHVARPHQCRVLITDAKGAVNACGCTASLPRFHADGSILEDIKENPLHLARVQREANEKEKLEAEALEPWSRAKVERTLARAASEGVLGVVNGQEVKSDANFHGADLSGLDLSGLDLSRANLHGAKLAGAKLSGCRLVNANLHEADLSGASIDGANAVEANFHGACLCGSNVDKTHFMKANLSECCREATDGIDIEEKPLTAAEDKVARYRQSEGFRAHILTDEAVVRYYGATLEGANVHGMKTTCKRRAL